MKKCSSIALCACCAGLLLTASCAPAPRSSVSIARRPDAGTESKTAWQAGRGLEAILTPDGETGLYLSCADLREADLSTLGEALSMAAFDERTQWPEKLPEGFDPVKLMESGKDPGLGVRALHEQGITGKGVGIAIIDQALLVDHQEYADRLRYYAEFNGAARDPASMHGPAVASIALGKTVGVAPDALLYYIADDLGAGTTEEDFVRDMTDYAEDIGRFVKMNETLPEGEKIRVISISAGYVRDTIGAEAMDAAIAEAEAAGIVVFLSGNSSFMGAARDPYADPDDPASYLPGVYWESWLLDGELDQSDALLIPMDDRTTAAENGPDSYAYYGNGGASWKVPYSAGLYALACQVKPDVTGEEFEAAARDTARPAYITYEGKELLFGNIVDPAALLEKLKRA